MAWIEVQNLRKRFGAQAVLDGVNFRVESGEALAIIGRSGCGKSVLLKHLIGLLQPDTGSVQVDGENLARMNERALLQVRRKFGMLFQSAALFDSLSVAENVGFVLLRERKLSPPEIAHRVAEVLELVELGGTEGQMPAELSGGMKKRVGLARALIYRPQIVLYDEPTTGLDPVVSDSIDQLIARVCAQLKVTSVVVTHDMRTVRRVTQRVLLLHQGRIYASGTPVEFFASADPLVNRFVHGIADPKEVAL